MRISFTVGAGAINTTNNSRTLRFRRAIWGNSPTPKGGDHGILKRGLHPPPRQDAIHPRRPRGGIFSLRNWGPRRPPASSRQRCPREFDPLVGQVSRAAAARLHPDTWLIEPVLDPAARPGIDLLRIAALQDGTPSPFESFRHALGIVIAGIATAVGKRFTVGLAGFEPATPC